jgi:putative ABC transport system substrate-binding protein
MYSFCQNVTLAVRYIKKSEGFHMNKRLAAVVLCCVMLAVTACGGKGKKESDAASENAAAETTAASEPAKYTPAVHDDDKYYVGIIQQSGHEALDLTAAGFIAELTDMMGDEVVVDLKVADGSTEDCDLIIDHFLQDKDDLILACGTMALRQSYAATKDVPIIGAAVTDFIIAGGVSSVGEPGENVTGISDLPPMQSLRDYLLQVSDGGKIGIVYCSNEDNSEFQVRIMEKYLDDAGTEYEEFTFHGKDDLEAVLDKACKACGTLYLPNDNMLADNMDTVKRISLKEGTRVFASDESMCKNGALAAYSVDYYELGKRTADIAYETLEYYVDKFGENGSDVEEDEDRGDPAKISIDRVRDTAGAYYNPEVAEALGWSSDGSFTALEIESAESGSTEAAE